MIINYISLYRKYRPTRFSEVIGQDVSIKILTNSILKGEIFHAYIFNGTRGTGKTTVARILAKALNCLNLNGFEPCNECYNCKSIMNSSFPDVIEIDAASNRGINEIREIRDNVKLSPLKGKYKVYIIDEVHMLTIEAFNALLKTLEEPPKNVVFILATTDIHKVPITILSRCQQIEFKRVDYHLIFNHLKNICSKEGINIEDDALIYISKLAKGSVRDSISILEQVKNISEHITLDDIFKIFSIYSFELIRNYIYNILEGNFKEIINIINLIKFNAVNIYNFLYNLNNELKEIIYYYFNSEIFEKDLTIDQIKFYKSIINKFDIKLVYELLKNLNSVLNYYKNDNDYYLFEIQTLSFIFNLNKLSNQVFSKLENSNIENKLKDLKNEIPKMEIGRILNQTEIEEDTLKVNTTKDFKQAIKEEIKEQIKQEIKEEIKENNSNLEIDVKSSIISLIPENTLQSAIKAADKVILNNNSLIFYYDSSKKINQTYKNLIRISKEKIKNYLSSKYVINEIILSDDIKKKTLI
ncbi:MAG: DNA polymerase III subunit gamma/tau [bacterium]